MSRSLHFVALVAACSINLSSSFLSLQCGEVRRCRSPLRDVSLLHFYGPSASNHQGEEEISSLLNTARRSDNRDGRSNQSWQNQGSPVERRSPVSGNLTLSEYQALLSDFVRDDDWNAVIDTLNDITRSMDQEFSNAQSPVQISPLFQFCLQAACLRQPQQRPIADSGSSLTNTQTDVALQILQLQIIAGISPTAIDHSLVIFHQCRQAHLEGRNGWRKAWNLLKHYQLTTPDLPIEVYDAVLTCMAEQGRESWQESVNLLKYLQERNNETNAATPPPAVSTYRLVIESCVQARKPNSAVKVLKSAVSHGVTPSLYSFELVIGLLCNHNSKLPHERNNWRQALQLLTLMDEMSVPMTLQIGNAVLVPMSRAGEVAQAKHLLHKMMKTANAKPNVVSYNSIISACVNTGQLQEALRYFDLCVRSPGVQPDIYTYTNCMRACSKAGNVQRALSLLQVAKDKKLPLDAYAYTAVIDACSKQKMWTKALELLQEMDGRKITPTEVTYSAVINACGNGGQWEKALDLFDQMKRRKHVLVPSRITYNGVLTALSKAAKQAQFNNHGNAGEELDVLWTHAHRLLQEMESNRVEKDGFTYSAALVCCHDKWEKALQLIDQMRQATSAVPNKIAYTAAIVSCGKAGQASAALALFENMKEDGIMADSVTYNALFDAIRTTSTVDSISHSIHPTKKAKLVLDLWTEMMQQGRRQERAAPRRTPGNFRTTSAMNIVTPDMITVTNAMGALMSKEGDCRDMTIVAAMDHVYSDAIELGVVTATLHLEGIDNDKESPSPPKSSWNVDLSGLSFPVARAACRFVFRKIQNEFGEKRDTLVFRNLILTTGVGPNRDSRKASQRSLRDYVQELLLTSDFNPPIESHIPSYAPGTVQISSEMIRHWVLHTDQG